METTPSDAIPADALGRRIALVPKAGPGLKRAEEDLADALAGEDGATLAAVLEAMPTARDLILSAASDSPYLRDLAFRRPARLAAVLAANPEAHVDALVARLDPILTDEPAVMKAVRTVKQEAALLIALADLGGVWDVTEVTRALTRIADACVGAGVRFLLAEAHRQGKLVLPDPENPETGSGWILLAMASTAPSSSTTPPTST